MKAVVPVMKVLPVVQIVEVVGVILNHSANMQRIKSEYRLAKREMTNRYNTEMKALEYDMQRFKTMAKIQREYFDREHKERLVILGIIQDVSQSLSRTTDTAIAQILNDTMHRLLESYQDNHQKSVGYFSNNTPALSMRGEA